MKQAIRRLWRTGIGLVLLLSLILSACTSSSDDEITTTTQPPASSSTADTAPATTTSSTATPSPEEPPVPEERPDPGFYLMLMWHQHQPNYPVDTDGVYSRPWVRVHATKDYYDMADHVGRYPEVKAVFNLTPVLLLQLEALSNGAKDLYWVRTEIPAEQLTDDEKRFIAERFFDTNPGIIDRFPRYRQLADDRGELGVDGVVASWSPADFRDLQVLFNLAWTDPDFLAESPLAELVTKARDYSEEDKTTVLDEHLRIIREVIPLHRQLWDQGQIEVTTTPLAHPILPLISDTDLGVVGDPAALLPQQRFREILDADQQVIRGLDEAERLLGRRPVGMWPGEGSVAQIVMSLFSKNGVRWVATGEDVLAQSLDISFTRDALDTVEQPELFYPWQATLSRNPPVPMFFRDVRLSDLIGFEYSGSSGEAGAEDFMMRIRQIYDQLDAEGRIGGSAPPVVSVILDGENAWEHYPNDGKEFLDGLYRRLSEADWVQTITPSEYLSRFDEPASLEEVFPASWFQPNYATWIGEEEEAIAWDYLYQVRDDLRDFERSLEDPESDARYQHAYETMLFAEGSDWFWWYGADQSSGDDAYFDRAFRELLGQVYDHMGQPRPDFVRVPIIPDQPRSPEQAALDLMTVNLDGIPSEWEAAGYFSDFDEQLRFGFDQENLFLSFTVASDDFDIPVDIYLEGTGEAVGLGLGGEVLGFRATHVIRFDADREACLALLVNPDDCSPLEAAVADSTFELKLPLADLGQFESGDVIRGAVYFPGSLTGFLDNSVLSLQVPDLSDLDVVLEVADPIGDDTGPGNYTYPTDAVFPPAVYDLELFQLGLEDDEIAFVFDLVGAVDNPWGSPRGLSVQTFDIYIDTDPGLSTGARRLIDGRNAVLEEEFGWEYALTVEGWEPALFISDPAGVWEETAPTMDVVVFGDKGKVVARLPQSLFGGSDPSTWGVAVAVMSQEGFPSTGVRRVRDVDPSSSQWRVGGAHPGAINHPRILDALSPDPGTQEAALADFPVVTEGSVDELDVDQFGKLPMNLPG